MLGKCSVPLTGKVHAPVASLEAETRDHHQNDVKSFHAVSQWGIAAANNLPVNVYGAKSILWNNASL